MLVLVAGPAAAHPTPFSRLTVDVTSGGVDVTAVAYVFDFAAQLGLAAEGQALDRALVGPRFERLSAWIAGHLRIELDGRALAGAPVDVSVAPDRKTATIRIHYPARDGRRIRVTGRLFPYDPLHETFVSVYRDRRLAGEAILTADRPSMEQLVDGAPSRLEVLRQFTRSGIEHIAIGPDHVLFLIGLLLLGGSVWRLARIVTGFTLAHSLTLSMAVLGVVSPPARLIEPAIALSICAVGIDNLVRRPGARDHRAWMAFAFGLVHGFGFANVLRAMDLPRAALGWSLFAFNLGVEIGQLGIVVTVALALAWLGRLGGTVRERIATAGSLAVLWAGFFWFIERVFFV